MTSPHPLAAWVERAQTDQPRRTTAERFLDADPEADDRDDRRRRRAHSVFRAKRARAVRAVSRVRYS